MVGLIRAPASIAISSCCSSLPQEEIDQYLVQQAAEEEATADEQREPDQAQGFNKKRKLDSGEAELVPKTDAEYVLRLSPDALRYLSVKKFKGMVSVDIREFYKVGACESTLATSISMCWLWLKQASLQVHGCHTAAFRLSHCGGRASVSIQSQHQQLMLLLLLLSCTAATVCCPAAPAPAPAIEHQVAACTCYISMRSCCCTAAERQRGAAWHLWHQPQGGRVACPMCSPARHHPGGPGRGL
jgi:hypothetical protein